MVSKNRSQVKGHLSQGHQIFVVCVELIDSWVLKVLFLESLLRYAVFYASYLRKILKEVASPPPCAGEG